MQEYLKHFIPRGDTIPLSIVLAGITYPDPTYHITRTDSDVLVIEYVTDGAGYVVLEGEIHPVGKDTIYILPAGCRHDYRSDSEQPFTKIFMNISGSLAEHLLLAYGLTGKFIFDGTGLKASFERIASVLASERSDSEMQAALQGIFVEILAGLSVAQSENSYSNEALKLKYYLDSHPDRIVSAEELAKTIFRSKDYCLKLFRREFRITPYAYQIERKIETAKALLADTHTSIGDIAEKLGYSDIHYFSNLFQKKCGCRPSEYRKSRR